MKHTLIALMEDKPGVLNRVSSLFYRRNYNIESLSVGHSEIPGISRMTIVLEGEDRIVEQVVKQLSKLINVTHVLDVSDKPTVVRELALIKVKAASRTRSEIAELVRIFRARIVDVGATSLTIEITGPEDRVNSLVGLLRPFGIEEMARTGRVVMVRSGENDDGNNGKVYSSQTAMPQSVPLMAQEVPM
ncbi:MAG: acetolactate synthase small subunit [Anaerolineae bacterium]|jgi:acetolactate synthase-1/3 small subunit|nr:acetolactate synthase small subunit [Anaerolineae bacterium]MDH7473782.1 acetolactate synthase small subunit [Anaerolineae bacterium]